MVASVREVRKAVFKMIEMHGNSSMGGVLLRVRPNAALSLWIFRVEALFSPKTFRVSFVYFG